jgi:predicted RNase H-like HicB family nuclease
MNHYIAIFVETDFGDWRVVFPDVPGCEAKGFTFDDAKFAAVSALVQSIREGGSPPRPMDLEAVQRNEEWLSRHHIDLSKAIVSMIPLAS